MASNPHRRKCYLINKKIQLRYALYILSVLIMVSLASSVCLTFGVWNLVVKEFSKENIKNRLQIASHIHDYGEARMAQTQKENTRLADFNEIALLSTREKEIFEDILSVNNKELVLKTLLLFLFIALGTIFLTHRIAGPLFRFQKTFEDIKDGDVAARVHLRKGDHAQEITPYLNAMIGSLDYTFSKMKMLTTKLFQELEMRGTHSENIMQYKKEIQEELNRYKTTDAYRI